ncbi:hypothetical protein P3T41_001139 [Kitasatospora sp. GAS204B]|nr:hypothetical protein [Kitasatospora sp. GAS204B]
MERLDKAGNARTRLAAALRTLHQSAGGPSLHAVVRRAAEHDKHSPLNTSSISEWINCKSIPGRKRELAVLVRTLLLWGNSSFASQKNAGLAIEEIARIERLRLAAQAEKRSPTAAKEDATHHWVGRPLAAWSDPIALEVHRPINVAGSSNDLPEYLERAHDQIIANALAEDLPRLIVIVGGSSTGKTRAAYEAIRKLPQDWYLHHPISPNKPEALIKCLQPGKLKPRTIIWLNELQEYLFPASGEKAAAALREFLSGNDEVVAIGTLWPDYWQDLTRARGPEEDDHSQARGLLKHAAQRIDIAPDFSASELEELGNRDPRVRMALKSARDRVTQYIAAGPALVEFFIDSQQIAPGAWAMLSAAMDWCVVGNSNETTEGFLRIASEGYLDDDQWGTLQDEWFCASLDHAMTQLHGAIRPLTRIRSRDDDSPGIRYRLADYLLQDARQNRSSIPVPASFWRGVLAAEDGFYIPTYAHAAEDRGMHETAAQLWAPMAMDGDPVALASLLRNPRADQIAVQSMTASAIDSLDQWDSSSLGWLLQELRDFPEWSGIATERVSRRIATLPVASPIDMGSILELLERHGHLESVAEYSLKIEQNISSIDLTEPSEPLFLVEILRESATDQAQRTALVVARHVCETEISVGNFALLLALMHDTDIFSEGVRRLEGMLDKVDTTNLMQTHPLAFNMRSLGLTDASRALLRRVSETIGDLSIDQSYAPLEIMALLQGEGFHDGAFCLAVRVSKEYDPGLTGAAAHTLRKLNACAPRSVVEEYAQRMAHSGPIIPVEDAAEVADFFGELEMSELRRIYLARVNDFLLREGS